MHSTPRHLQGGGDAQQARQQARLQPAAAPGAGAAAASHRSSSGLFLEPLTRNFILVRRGEGSAWFANSSP